MKTEALQKPLVAYFSAEYGFEADLPLYAGGLGILSGDTVKEAADCRFPMVAVGLLYRGGKAKQLVDEFGNQTEADVTIDPLSKGFEHVYDPDDPDQPLFVRVHLTKQDVWARVWKKSINQVSLYLLDTDTDQNLPDDRLINHALYYGSEESIVKQQLLLGIGGVKLLTSLKIEPTLYHVNEGRPAFLHWQLIRFFMDHDAITYQQARDKARAMTVYTNHTLVKAGNMSYDISILKEYAQYYSEKMHVTIDELLAPGLESESGKFNMTQFALNTSRKASAVSKIHYELSRSLWPEYTWVSITNGVHMPTWQDNEIRSNQHDPLLLWQTHEKKKSELAAFVNQRTSYTYDPHRLVISWARRIAGYKRPISLFEDVTRLSHILKNADRPVQLLLAGKAHASDTSAKTMLRQIIEYMQEELSGSALFIADYSIEVAKMMVAGSDVWINTPLPGQEASGTSGMKALANGVLQLTVEDGWSAEVDWTDIGWPLDGNHLAESFYLRLEHDIVPTFYRRNQSGLPVEWIQRMQRSIDLATQFSATRMLGEYQELLYTT